MSNKKVIKITSNVAGFAEDKDEAKQIRINEILPALGKGMGVIIDFKDINYATQSYVHALIGEALNKYKERSLDLIEFKNCSKPVQGVIELVVDYSLGGFADKK